MKLALTPRGWQLLREGKPYLVRGGGGDGSMPLLAKMGGNSVRTWGVDEGLKARLDEAEKLGLSVCVGIWLGQERQGFDYNDVDQVAQQAEAVRKAVETFRNHPAVLLWGLGNEMEGDGTNAAIWSTINGLAAEVKRLDPNHPTMTVIAELGDVKVRNLHRLCPEIDIVGINSYGGGPTVGKRYVAAGGTKPFLLTEFGPPGRWEIQATDWGAPPELTSTAKARHYEQTYVQTSRDAAKLWLGSYGFIWGHKQEATATWFGMLLPDGTRLAAADAMSRLWTGRPVANQCPELNALKLEGPDQVEPGATLRLSLEARDPEGDPLNVKWVVQKEAAAYGSGGDTEPVPTSLPGAVVRSDERSAEVRASKEGGGYRVFAYVFDGNGGAAVANVPFLVKGPMTVAVGRKARLPLVVYDEAGAKESPYAPSGWMGNVEALKLDEACAERPHAGKTCARIDYAANDQWAGIVWQDPPNDWGDQPGGWDLRGAKKVTFWARGGQGGEVVSFELGLLGKEKKYGDTGRVRLGDVKLSAEWQPVTIELGAADLSRIKSGFAIVIAGSGKPVTVYLDDVRYE